MESNNFKISADLLQKNAAKSSIRDLNAEFQRKGGKVIQKNSKKGTVFQLSHPDAEYLEKFRIRLFLELGLMDESEIPDDIKEEEKIKKPRYGDKHKLRKGWNVRSPKEFKEGVYNRDERPQHRDEAGTGSTVKQPSKEMSEMPERGRADTGKSRRTSEMAPQPTQLTDEEKRVVDLVEEALKQGAVDDGEIIKYAYQKEVSKEEMKKLKKMLWNNKCYGNREDCPYKKKKYRFEDMMKAIYGNVEGCENIKSPFKSLSDLWVKNVEEMYGPFKDKQVEVKGKVSSYKPVYRKGNEHFKILVYDTEVKIADSDEEPKMTRKLWVKVDFQTFDELTGDTKVHIDDHIVFKGKCVLDSFFHDYWVTDLKSLDVVEEGGGEVITAVNP